MHVNAAGWISSRGGWMEKGGKRRKEERSSVQNRKKQLSAQSVESYCAAAISHAPAASAVSGAHRSVSALR